MATLAEDDFTLFKRAGGTLTYDLVNSVGRSIVDGKFQDQPFPTEAELAKGHGVSRSVTREAVKMVTAKGLLGARPKFGTFVQPQENWNLFDTDVLRWIIECRRTPNLLRHFNELRLGIEPQAAALAAKRATESDLAAIHRGLERMKDAVNGNDDPLRADVSFHVAILRAADNPFYAQFRDMVGTALTASIRFTNRKAGGKETLADHAAVYDAIASRIPEAAHDAMFRLIREALAYIEQTEKSARGRRK